jgi:hypothetical protein
MVGKKSLLVSLFLWLCCSMPMLAADTKTPRTELSAAQIVEKHIAARGGLQAWRTVQAMSWTGKMDAGTGTNDRAERIIESRRGHHVNKVNITDSKDAMAKEKGPEQVQLPFVLEMKRPRKSRVEIQFAGKTAVQVYDGVNGWKVRPFLNRNDVEPFTAAEVKSEQGRAELDGPLVDYAAKGTKVELEGVEKIQGRDAYKLKLTTKTGDVQHVWIDAQNFLDVKIEGAPRRMDGRMHTVWIYQRDFRSVQGLIIPFALETEVEGYRDTHKMIIEKVAVNPKLDDALFAKPKG